VSFYVSDEEGSDVGSTIKFGSYDPVGLAPGEKLSLIRTADPRTWDIAADEIKLSLGDDKAANMNLVENSRVRFEP